MQIKKFLKNLYDEVDYLPVASSIKGLGELAAKAVAKTIAVSKAISGFTGKSTAELTDSATVHRVSYLKNRSKLRCLLLFIPIFGNVSVAIYDLKKSYNKKQTIKQIINYSQSIKNSRQPTVEIIQHSKAILELLKKEVFKKDPSLFKHVDEKFREDYSFMLEAVKINPNFIKYTNEEFKNDPFLILQLLEKNPDFIQYIGLALKNNALFMSEAVQMNQKFIRHIGKELKRNFAFMVEMMEKKPSFFRYANSELQSKQSFKDVHKEIKEKNSTQNISTTIASFISKLKKNPAGTIKKLCKFL